MAKRLVFVIIALALLTFYASSRVIFRMPEAMAHPWLSWGAAVLFFFLQLLGPFGDRLWFPALKRKGWVRLVFWADWLSYFAFGAMSIMVAYGLAFDIGGFVWQMAAPPPDMAAFDRWVLGLYAGSVALTLAVGVLRVCSPVVERVDIPLHNLPPAFDGFTIAQISDLHVGPTIKRPYVQKVVDAVNALNPDIIALTGDFIDGTVEDLADDVAPLMDLRARDGKFFVTGNHECSWNPESWTAEFRRLGTRVLENEHEAIKRGDSTIYIAGVNDYASGDMDIAKAVRGLQPDDAIILLSHQPASYSKAEAAGVDLQLSGHSHAGQYFPFTLIIRFFQRYYKGLNRHGKMWIYVSRGTGYWGPPLRAGAPAEITLLTLRKNPADLA